MNTDKKWLRLANAGLVLVLVLSLFGTASADQAPPSEVLGPAGPAGTEDGGVEILDVGAEYPSADAPPLGVVGPDDRPVHRDSAWNFYNKMRAAGYTGSHSFIWGNTAAWETDWKRAALGGSENSWVDNVDIMFVHSHGNYNAATGVGSVWFPWDHTDTNLVPNECAWSWGDKDVEWIGIKTCLSLRDRQGWGTCMNGVHIIAGFTTLSASREFGGHWADQLLGSRACFPIIGCVWLRSPKTVTQAWFTACDQQTSGATARVLAEANAHFSDKVWTRGGPALGDVVDNWYHWIDHNCYKPAPAAIDTSILAEVPSYPVLPRTVDAGFAASLAATLNVSGTLSLSPDGQEYAVTDTTGGVTRTLSIQTATGGYLYQDLNQLWVPPEPGQPLNLPDPTTAASLAGAYFLANAQALPGGTNFDPASQHIETDSMDTTGKPGTAAALDGVRQTTGVDVMVAYGRTLATTATTPSGDAIDVNVSVSGPGGATKLYLGGQGETPIGLSGGSRDVQSGNPVTLKDVDTSWDAFLADPDLSVLEISIEYDSIVRKSDTFAYYEQPLDVDQAELVPTWVYTVDFVAGGEVVGTDGLIYVPASPAYYPPELTIDSPAAGATILAGKRIPLNATVTSGNAPFTYEWSSSTQGVLGTTEDITTMLLSTGKAGDPPQPVTVSLKVTDENGLYRIEEITVNVVGQPSWLPIVLR